MEFPKGSDFAQPVSAALPPSGSAPASPSVRAGAGERPGVSVPESGIHAIVRHVSDEGCQLLPMNRASRAVGAFVPGDALRIVVAEGVTVRGVVRWVLDDRLGLAFRQSVHGLIESRLSHHARQGVLVLLERG